MAAIPTARERARAALTADIVTAARAQLADTGAAGLSLRAVARELGMVSSAIHRYFPTKDDLLTALIIDGYNAVGQAVEDADAACERTDYFGRWRAVCRAVRTWALEHPQEYALLYGSPVPGYEAPMDTVPAAVRDTAVFGTIVSEADKAGALAPKGPELKPPASFAADAQQVREVIPDVSDAMIARAVSAWTGLYGWVNFELFGQFNNVLEDRDVAFDLQIDCLAGILGLSASD